MIILNAQCYTSAAKGTQTFEDTFIPSMFNESTTAEKVANIGFAQ